MQIVIDIPEVFYEYCKAQKDAIEIQLAVKNGIPLPEGHGRIIDESEIKHVYYHEEKAEHGVINFRGIVIDGTDAPTIIEACDKQLKGTERANEGS